LIAPHRFFVREGTLDMKQSDSKKQKTSAYQVFCFNDLMLVCKKGNWKKKKRYQCEVVISLHESELKNVSNEDRAGFRLVVVKRNVVYTFYAPDEKTRDEWTADIEKNLNLLKKSAATSIEDTPVDEDLQTKLCVRLLAGKDLLPCIYSLANLYVEFSVGTYLKRSSVKKDCRFNPEWEETFLIDVEDPVRQTLNVKVKDGKTNTILGSVDVSLINLYDYVEKVKWHKLQSSSSHGEILIGLTVGPSFGDNGKNTAPETDGNPPATSNSSNT